MLRGRIILAGAILAVIATVLMVVIGNVAVERSNPPVTYTINWDSPDTERLARTACFDCHSNETHWPWYAHIAPAAFLLANDVAQGRDQYNFSTGYQLDGDKMAKKVEAGEMPPMRYLLLHPEANLSAEERAQLAAGLRATFSSGFRFQFAVPAPEATPQTTPEAGSGD